jgi:aminoglycoside phosphotransferase (APT) family kinase protein
MAKGPLIAHGRSADVYAWDDDCVVKLFVAGRPRADVEQEAAVTRAAAACGLPVPSVSGLVEEEGRVGMVCGKVGGETMLRRMPGRPWLLGRWAAMLGGLHARVHGARTDVPTSQADWVRTMVGRAVRLPDGLRQAALARAESLGGRQALCHGDFHPDNVLLSADGPVIIDWDSAVVGDPMADVAATVLMLRTARPTPAARRQWLLDAGRALFCRLYLRRYARLGTLDRERVAAWLPVVAAARFAVAIPEEEPGLLDIVRDGLQEDDRS